MSIRLAARTCHENAGDGTLDKGAHVEKEGARSEEMVLLTSVLRQKRSMYPTLLYWTLIWRRKEKRVVIVGASSKTEPQP